MQKAKQKTIKCDFQVPAQQLIVLLNQLKDAQNNGVVPNRAELVRTYDSTGWGSWNQRINDYNNMVMSMEMKAASMKALVDAANNPNNKQAISNHSKLPFCTFEESRFLFSKLTTKATESVVFDQKIQEKQQIKNIERILRNMTNIQKIDLKKQEIKNTQIKSIVTKLAQQLSEVRAFTGQMYNNLNRTFEMSGHQGNSTDTNTKRLKQIQNILGLFQEFIKKMRNINLLKNVPAFYKSNLQEQLNSFLIIIEQNHKKMKQIGQKQPQNMLRKISDVNANSTNNFNKSNHEQQLRQLRIALNYQTQQKTKINHLFLALKTENQQNQRSIIKFKQQASKYVNEINSLSKQVNAQKNFIKSQQQSVIKSVRVRSQNQIAQMTAKYQQNIQKYQLKIQEFQRQKKLNESKYRDLQLSFQNKTKYYQKQKNELLKKQASNGQQLYTLKQKIIINQKSICDFQISNNKLTLQNKLLEEKNLSLQKFKMQSQKQLEKKQKNFNELELSFNRIKSQRNESQSLSQKNHQYIQDKAALQIEALRMQYNRLDFEKASQISLIKNKNSLLQSQNLRLLSQIDEIKKRNLQESQKFKQRIKQLIEQTDSFQLQISKLNTDKLKKEQSIKMSQTVKKTIQVFSTILPQVDEEIIPQKKQSSDQLVEVKQKLQKKMSKLKETRLSNKNLDFFLRRYEKLAQKINNEQQSNYQPLFLAYCDSLFQHKLLQDKQTYKCRIVEHLSLLMSKTIKKTQLIYVYDPQNKAGFHTYILNRSNLLCLVKLVNGVHIVGYYSGVYQNQMMISPGMLMNINDNMSFKLKQNKLGQKPKVFKSMIFDKYYIIFGNAELRIRSGQLKLFSNFGITNSFFDNKGIKNTGFIKHDQAEIEIQGYEIYEIKFEENEQTERKQRSNEEADYFQVIE